MDQPVNLSEAVKADLREKIVQPRADQWSVVEQHLNAAFEAIAKLDNSHFHDGWRAGIIGYLDAGIARGRILELQGVIGKAIRLKFEAHRAETDVAERHGIDVPQITTKDGGGGR